MTLTMPTITTTTTTTTRTRTVTSTTTATTRTTTTKKITTMAITTTMTIRMTPQQFWILLLANMISLCYKHCGHHVADDADIVVMVCCVFICHLLSIVCC